jgi:Xaa-Pro aminopeptidase
VPEDLSATYRRRRQTLMEKLDGGLALIDSSGVSPDPLLYDKNLRYLVGPSPRDSALLLAPGGIAIDRLETLHGPELGRGREVREILFVRQLTEQEKKIDGEGPSSDSVQGRSGVDAVKSLDQLEQLVCGALMRHDTLWVNVAGVPKLSAPPAPGHLLLQQIQQRLPWVRFRNAASLIHDMRWVKDAHEIDCLRRAFEIHAKVFSKLMQALKPGTNESLGQATYDYEMGLRSHEGVSGAWNDLYSANLIVAAGKNAPVAHYMANDQPIADGDLVLIDGGVEVEGYCSDISRTFPANGRFTDRQRELYQIVLDAQKAAIATMKPGATALDAHRAAYEQFAAHGLAEHSWGTCGHPVGLNIHDANGWRADDDRQLEPGAVLVIEPFLTLPDDGIGIRIEDGVLITADGHELLPGPPREVDEVEALCGDR